MDGEQAGPSGSVVTRSQSYLRESVAELRKVSHPTRAETLQTTMVAIVIVMFAGFCLFVLDLIFDQVMRALL